MIYWLTGQPGSGKSTLAKALQAALKSQGRPVVHLDGEFLREVTGNADYSEEGRIKNITAGQKMAKRLDAEGVVVVASFVSPYRNLREAFKRLAPVVEVYVHTTAARGREAYFAAGFEPPERDFVDIDTTHASVEDCIAKILAGVPVNRTGGGQAPAE